MNAEFFNQNGFEIFDQAIDNQTIDYLIEQLSQIDFGHSAKQRRNVAFGIRNLLNAAPVIKDFVDSAAIRRLIEPFAGKEARVVRAIFFDKTPEANWKVPFHQDLTIAVRDRKLTAGFASWTQKAGIWHVQPPAEVLEKIIALRVHLDNTDESNGALRVIPGSHLFGRLSAEQIEKMKRATEIKDCPVKRGGAMLMQPLLLHASSAAAKATHRRVLHFEFTARQLPGELEWFGS